MASGSLFETEERSGTNVKAILIAIAAFVFVGAAGYGAYRYTAPPPPDFAAIKSAEVRESMVYLLAQPSFSGEELRTQLLGIGRLEKYRWREKEVYFTFPETPEEEFQSYLAKYFVDPGKIDFGKNANGVIQIDEYKLRPNPVAMRFFKTTIDNFRLDTDQSVNFPFSTASYTLSLSELSNFSNNLQLYGGNLVAKAPSRSDQPQMAFANHGIMVAKPGEPSLKRLIDTLLAGVGDNREARIQRLTDFVSTEIEYSYTEAVSTREKLKRASETLMTRSGDCSNKTILLASMLEQIGEEYLLLYSPQHITVAVPQGNFANDNQLDLDWAQRKWVIAETTAADFQIGLSPIVERDRLVNVQYVQDPKNSNVIYDAHTFGVLQFL